MSFDALKQPLVGGWIMALTVYIEFARFFSIW